MPVILYKLNVWNTMICLDTGIPAITTLLRHRRQTGRDLQQQREMWHKKRDGVLTDG